MIPVTQTHLRKQLEMRRHRLQSVLQVGSDGHLQHLLDDVDQALANLETPRYGICTRCHDPIEPERLFIDPLSHFCLGCLTEDETRALEHDLDTAAHIQAALLPDRDQRHPGWELGYEYQPLGAVSGDHLDLIAPPNLDQPMLFLFGDASGKGVAASLLMSHLHALFRSLVSLDIPLEEVLLRANRIFCESTMANCFATLIAGKLHTDGTVEISNLGHLPGLVVKKDRIDTIESTAMPFGLFAESEFDVRSLSLDVGDSLILYTDGLAEARNSAGEEYGLLRLEAGLSRTWGWSAQQILDLCLQDLAEFRNGSSLQDDLTLMVCKVAS